MRLALGAIGAAILFTTGALLLFCWIAWHAYARAQRRGLVAAWLLGVVSLSGAMAIRIGRQQVALGSSLVREMALDAFLRFLPMWAIALGAAAYFIERRARHPHARLTRGTLWKGVGVGLLGILGFFFAYAIMDIGQVLG